MRSTFPTAFSQGYFPSGNFPTVQFLKRQLSKSVLAAALGPLAHLSSAWPQMRPAAPQKAKAKFLRSCHLGIFTMGSRPWEIAFGKIPRLIKKIWLGTNYKSEQSKIFPMGHVFHFWNNLWQLSNCAWNNYNKKIKLVDPNISNALFYAFKIADNLWKTKIVKSYIVCHLKTWILFCHYKRL